MKSVTCAILVFSVSFMLRAGNPKKPESFLRGGGRLVSTFSIAACDPATGELGVAVASRFFAVGTVVPWAKAGAGAVATQAFANTTFGPMGLEMLAKGMKPEAVLRELLKGDDQPERRQVGIVSMSGESATYTGKGCMAWAGGRHGPNYAVQGNILTGEAVVVAMEKAFLATRGPLAERMYAALSAGDREGGDARGRQSAALIVVKANAGYGGYTDRAIDIRVDDHPDPFKELGRLLAIAQLNYAWNEAWTLFSGQKYAQALPLMERAAAMGTQNPEVQYDLGVIRLAAGKRREALEAFRTAFIQNPQLKRQAAADGDLKAIRGDAEFERMIKE